MRLLTAPFWRHIAWTLVRTALAGAVPFLPGLASDLAGTWPLAAGTIGLLLIAAIVTALAGIVTPDTAPWPELLLSRGMRQFGQFFAAGLVGAVVLSDVNWLLLLQGAVASALSTMILAALTVIPGDTAPAISPLVIPGEVVPPLHAADEVKAADPEIEPDDADVLGPDDDAVPDPLRDERGV